MYGASVKYWGTVIKRVRVDLGTSYKAASWSHAKIPMLVDTKFIFSW